MRQGPFCCEKAENKNKRTHTVAQTCTRVQLHKGDSHVCIRPHTGLSARHGSPLKQSAGQPVLLSLWKFVNAETYCQWAPWLCDESWEAWPTVSSCIKHMTVTQHGWGPLRHAARGSWLVWRSTYFPCPGGCLKPSTLYSNMGCRSLIEGPSLLLSVL